MTALAIIGSICSVGVLLLVGLIARDIVRHRRHQAEQAARDRAALPKRGAICMHGRPMNEVCPQCQKWMNEHISRLPGNPRRG